MNFFKKLWNDLVGHSIIPDIVNSIINYFSKLYNSIKVKVSSLVQTVSNYFSNLKNNIVSRVKGLYNSVNSTFNSLKSTVLNKINSLKSGIQNTFSGIYSLFNTLKSKARNIISGVNLYSAGKNLINGLVNGIRSKISSVKNAVASVSNVVKNYLGWQSPTKKGAGRNSDKWIPNLIKMLIEGFDNYKNRVAKAASNISKKIASNVTFTSEAVIPKATGVISASSISPIARTNNSSNNRWNVNIYADSFTNGKSVGDALIKELNRRGILTHR